jgi:LytS/YehU family sensor histidine kinase
VLEQLRIPGEFDFIFKIDGRIDTNHTEIPNMMLQPIVENCIRHGIKHLEDHKGMIEILMELRGTVIRCTITDNGIGRNPAGNQYEGLFIKQKSYGMDIVRKRLELLPGAEERGVLLEIDDLQHANGTSAGTRVSISLPYKIINE